MQGLDSDSKFLIFFFIQKVLHIPDLESQALVSEKKFPIYLYITRLTYLGRIATDNSDNKSSHIIHHCEDNQFRFTT